MKKSYYVDENMNKLELFKNRTDNCLVEITNTKNDEVPAWIDLTKDDVINLIQDLQEIAKNMIFIES